MKTWTYIINNFAHDLFTGIWFGSVVGIYTTQNQKGQYQPSPELSSVIAELQSVFFQLGLASLALIILTGYIRFLYRHSWDRLENTGRIKKKTLIIKHTVLGTALIAGNIYALLCVL